MDIIYTKFGVDFCRTGLKPMVNDKTIVICPLGIIDQLKKDLEIDRVVSYWNFFTNIDVYVNLIYHTFVFYEFQSFPKSVKKRVLDLYTSSNNKITLVKFKS